MPRRYKLIIVALRLTTQRFLMSLDASSFGERLLRGRHFP